MSMGFTSLFVDIKDVPNFELWTRFLHLNNQQILPDSPIKVENCRLTAEGLYSNYLFMNTKNVP